MILSAAKLAAQKGLPDSWACMCRDASKMKYYLDTKMSKKFIAVQKTQRNMRLVWPNKFKVFQHKLAYV